jgi:hypothetical protein
MVPRACGHLCEFQHYAVDKYRAQRLAKFQKTRCPECVAKMQEAQRLAAVPRGEAFRLLPAGAVITVALGTDGTWVGKLTASGRSVEADGEGPQGVCLALARLWLGGQPDPAKKAGS